MRKMSKYSPYHHFTSFPLSLASSCALVTLVAGGCSSDVIRLQSSSFSLFDNSLSNNSTSIVPVKGPYSLGHSGTGDGDPQIYDTNDQPITRGDLPPPVTSSSPVSVTDVSNLSSTGKNVLSGATSEFEIQQGDTLYRLAQRTGIPQEEIIRLNALKGVSLKAGQKIKIPQEKLASLAPEVPFNKDPVVSVIPSYSGKTLDINSQQELDHAESSLKTENIQKDILATSSEPSKNVVKSESYSRAPLPLTPSEMPSQGSQKQEDKTSQNLAMLKEGDQGVSLDQSSLASPRLLNAHPLGEAETPHTSGAKPNPERPLNASETLSEFGRLRWPLKGKIISAFGQRDDGTMNDGIDISVPVGTEIHAAEDGVVAYAGSELKAYGNLILVRHDKGMVTAYAHADEVKVKRGDRITRGQVIATAGRTGDVDQPKLHFEVREGPKAVDPFLHLEKL